jgi:hypothetical protein
MADDQQTETTIVQTETTATGDQAEATDARGAGGDDLDGLREALRKERDRARGLEKEVKPLRTFKAEREQAERTEAEKVAARIAELEGRVSTAQARERTYALRDAIEEAVSVEKLALAAPVGRVLRLIDADAVEYAEDGTPKNATALLKGLVKSDPYLFAARRAALGDGGAGREGGVGHNINDQIRRMSGRTG